MAYGAGSYCIGLKTAPTEVRLSIHRELAKLRLSERKTSPLSPEQRKDYFSRQVVPTYGLVEGSHEYGVLERACTTGIYGSNADDFKVPFDRVETAYAACGWNVEK